MKTDIKNTLLYKFAKRTYLAAVHFACDSKRKPLVKPLADSILDFCIDKNKIHDINQLSIISSNCFAGRIMQDLNMELLLSAKVF